MLKIGYFADGPWAHNALKKILERKDIQIEFLAPRFDLRDPVLVEMAHQNSIPVLYLENVNAPESLDKIKSFETDLLVSMSFNQIIKKKLIQLTKLGFINCHAGALPKYRGRNILNWALINDEKEFGITTHFIDEGIDTGDIILQKNYPISDSDNYLSLLEVAYVECAEILNETLSLFVRGDVKRTAQSRLGEGFYCSRRVMGDEYIDWANNSRAVFNFIRAISSPGICARTILDNKEFIIEKASLVTNACNYHGIPGQVVGSGADGILVKTLDSVIKVEEIWSDGKKIIPKLPIGTRFLNFNPIFFEQVKNYLQELQNEK